MVFPAAMHRLNRTLARLTGESIVYEHADGEFSIAAATRGRTELEVGDDFGIAHQAETDDWLVDAAALVVDGEFHRPRAGDLVHHTDAAGVEGIYEICHPGGEEPWRYCDPQRTRIRLHTKRIA